MTDPVSPREFDMLRSQVTTQGQAIAGMPGMAVQVGELIKDVAQVGQSLEQHRQDHAREEAQRKGRVRWAWGFALAALTLLESTLAVVLSQLR